MTEAALSTEIGMALYFIAGVIIMVLLDRYMNGEIKNWIKSYKTKGRNQIFGKIFAIVVATLIWPVWVIEWLTERETK